MIAQINRNLNDKKICQKLKITKSNYYIIKMKILQNRPFKGCLQ